MNPIRNRRISSASFDPRSISGLFFWFNAQFLSLADGAVISAYTDRSGAGTNLTAGAGTEPVYKAGIINGHPVARFVGASTQFMTSAAFGSVKAQPTTLFWVYSVTSTAANQSVVDALSVAASEQAGLISGAKHSIYAGATLNGPTAAANTPALVTGTFNGAASLIRVNGTGQVTGTASTNSLDGITLGRRSNGTQYFTGDLAEVLYYSGALSIAAIGMIESYLKNRYAL